MTLFSCYWGRIHCSWHHLPQHGRTSKPPSSSSPIGLRSLRLLPLRLRGISRHSLRPFPKTILQRMLHLRHSRLHLRQRSRGTPKLHDLREKTNVRSAMRGNSARPIGPKSEHRNLNPQLESDGHGRPPTGAKLGENLPGEAMEGVLPDGLLAVLHG